MLKLLSKMSGSTVMRLKSVVVVPKRSQSFDVIDEKDRSTIPRSKNVSQSKQPENSAREDKNDKSTSHVKKSKSKKSWPSIESLTRHANIRPLGVTDDWGPLTHKHELIPMDNVRYWHQHRCEVCDKLFEHKHKQRGDQSMNYNRHVCSVCGGTKGSRRVLFKNSQPTMDYRKYR
ncbi:hypothetical protein HA402_012867 [Bradysia odoriphaga]|nr:hypothetical protein HA402_012867 [Bradysia odoriphaga]